MQDPSPVRDAVAAVLARHGAPGAQVAVRVDGVPVLDLAVGHRDPDGDEALEVADRFYIYSVTKALLAGAVLKLAEDGLLALDQPVKAWLPDVPGLGTGVTVGHLLGHTSGLPDYGPLPEYHEAVREHPDRPWMDSEYLERTLGRKGMLFAPGAGWAYSNVGYMLLRRLLAEAHGQDIGWVIREVYGEPLGLRETAVAGRPGQGIVAGWSEALGDFGDVGPRYHPGWVAHSVVVSTARETAAMLDALASGRIVGDEWLGRMKTPSPPRFPAPPFRDAAYGLGLMLGGTERFGRAMGHNGEGPGYSASAWVFDDVGGRRVAAAALVNRDGHNTAQDVLFAVMERLCQ